YVLFDQIGRGGMADIYLASVRTGLGGSRLAVVKELLPELCRDAGLVQKIVDEAKLASQLSHVNVVQVFDLGVDGERTFIAMEYVEGFDLRQLLRNLSRRAVALPCEFAAHIACAVLRGLDYAHRARD